MADEKKSSIYDNGSSSELDEYGVWVTSEPADVSSDKLAGDNLTDLEAALGALEAQPLDEVSDDLEMSFDTLDLPDEEEEPQEELNVEDILAEDDGFTDDEILLDELPEELGKLEKIEEVEEIGEIDVLGAKEILPIDADAPTEEPKQLVDTTESAEHTDIEEKPIKTNTNTTEVFMENLLDDSPFDDDEDEYISATQEEKEELGKPALAETIASAEEIPVVAETPNEIDSEDNNYSIDKMSFDADAALAEAGIPIDVEVKEESASGMEEAPIERTVEPASKAEPLMKEVPESQKTEVTPNLSTELLLRIAEELSSIRKELSSLKQNFLEQRNMEVSSDIIPAEEESTPVIGGGFFDDSDDEKIALTGDELDDILMSADFTEEAGAGVTDDFETIVDEEIFEQEVSTEVEEERVIGTEKDSEELQKLREEGIVVPITPAPEDTSLLEVGEISQDEDALRINEYLDLSDAVIDEPDLQVIENPVQEPMLEGISFDDAILDMGDEEVEEPQAEEELAEEPEAEISLPEEEPTLEIPEPTAEPAAYEETVPTVEETSPSELIPDFEGPAETPSVEATAEIPSNIKDELKTVLSYMDQLLESLPEEKIEEFASSKYFDTYKKLFAELGIV
ncbi:MAG: hypothetical protein LBI40_00955 [Treponema sp.]|jgi:hypothetical protein|nr:hypothetical protein [Treponema sp.]